MVSVIVQEAVGTNESGPSFGDTRLYDIAWPRNMRILFGTPRVRN